MNLLHSAPGEDPVTMEAVFRATPERVFRAWTDPDEIGKWFGPSPDALIGAEIDLRIGGVWRFSFAQDDAESACLEGEYLTIQPNERLEFTWSHVVTHKDGRRDASPASKVSVTLTPEAEGVRLTLRHEAIQLTDARLKVHGGWVASFERMEALFAGEAGAAA
ncbi:MAG: SRPBCC domain-containing protein [Pseudomonadota bacterium]